MDGIDLLFTGGVIAGCISASVIVFVVGIVVVVGGGAELGCGARYACIFVVPFGDCTHCDLL